MTPVTPPKSVTATYNPYSLFSLSIAIAYLVRHPQSAFAVLYQYSCVTILDDRGSYYFKIFVLHNHFLVIFLDSEDERR